MQTIRSQFNRRLNFPSILAAYERAKLGKGRRNEVARFSLDLSYNLGLLIDDLRHGHYKTGAYRRFKIYEPKERDIMALPFRDRIAQQWYIEEFIKPYYVPRFIYHSYACVEGHGTHSAHKALRSFLYATNIENPDFYLVKMDISKFFYSIDKNILMNILARVISDPQILALTRIFVYDTAGRVGIPIGNYTSQFFANIYLNELDQYIKHTLRVRYYIRYMDDFVLIAKDKNEATELHQLCRTFLEQKLALRLNSKSRVIRGKDGILFCGFRIFHDHVLLSTRNKRSIHRKLRRFRKDGNKEALLMSLIAWEAHVKHADSFHYREKVYKLLADELGILTSCPTHKTQLPLFPCKLCTTSTYNLKHLERLTKSALKSP